MAQIEGTRLDSVSSPINKTGLQSRARRIHRLVHGRTAPARIHKGEHDRWRSRPAVGPISIFDIRAAAVRKLAVEAADNGLLAPELASGIARIKGVRSHGAEAITTPHRMADRRIRNSGRGDRILAIPAAQPPAASRRAPP